VRQRIFELYGRPMFRKSAMGIRDGAGVFEKFLKGKGYKTVLEIGTYKGVSAAEISQYVERVITIDLKQGRVEQTDGSFDRKAFWESLGIKNIELILVADDAEKKAIVDKLEFDFAFVDGGHDAQSVAFDFSIVKRCGRVLFHDADDNSKRAFKQDANNDVFEFIDKLPKEEVQFVDIFAMWTK
jgi:predicted O-methyltransferase YrrM